MEGIYQAHEDYGYARKAAEDRARNIEEVADFYRMGVSIDVIARGKKMHPTEIKEILRSKGLSVSE